MAVVGLISEIADHLKDVRIAVALKLPQQLLALVGAAAGERPVHLGLRDPLHEVQRTEQGRAKGGDFGDRRVDVLGGADRAGVGTARPGGLGATTLDDMESAG